MTNAKPGGASMRLRQFIFAFVAVMLTACFCIPGTTAKGQDAGASLSGTSWRLVKFEGGDGKTLTPDDKNKYTITFGADGGVAARLDCNRGHGTWKSPGANQVQFGPMALTRAMCPPGSLQDQIAKNWVTVRSYVIKDGHLFLSLQADGGTYEYEPVTAGPGGGDTAQRRNEPPPMSAADVMARGPFGFSCAPKSGGGTSSLKVMYYNTHPGLALIEFQNSTRPAFQALAASGAKFEGKEVVFWEHQGEAMLTWSGADSVCKRVADQ